MLGPDMRIFFYRIRRANGTQSREFVVADDGAEALTILTTRFPGATNIRLELEKEPTEGDLVNLLLGQVRDLRQQVQALKQAVGLPTAAR
jgi:nucleoside-diphosphate-sugar epimerase